MMWLVALLTFALPWVITPGTPNPFLEGKELLLTFGGWALVCWTSLRQPSLPSAGLRNPFLPWLALFLLAMGCLHFHWRCLWRTVSQTQVVYNVYTWLPTLSVIMALLLLRTLALHWFRHPPHLLQLTQWLCLSGALVSCYAIGQALGLDEWFAQDVATGNTWQGVYAGLGNPSYLAIYLAAIFPLCWLFKPRCYLLYGLMMLVAIWLTHVPYAWGLVGIGMAGYGVSRWWNVLHRWHRIALLIILLELIWLNVPTITSWAQGDERWSIWAQSWVLTQTTTQKVVESWTGRGLGAYGLVMPSQAWAHNEWLQALIELGVIGTGLFGLAIGWATRTAWRQAKTSLIDAGWFGTWLVLLVSSVIHFPFHIAPIIWVGLCAWAVIERDQGEVAYA